MSDAIDAAQKAIEYCLDLLGTLGNDADFVEDDALLILHERDVIEDRVDELTSEQRGLVHRLDEEIRAKRERFVGVVPNPATAHARWWWWMHQDAQRSREAKRSVA